MSITPGIMDNVGIAFHFENRNVDAFSGSAIDLDNWRLVGKAYGVSKFAMIDLSDARYRMNDEEVTLEVYDDLASFEAAKSADRLVYLVDRPTLLAQGFTPGVDMDTLLTYPHNPNLMTWYVFGPAAGFVPILSDGKSYMNLPQGNDNVNLFSFQVAPIIVAQVWWNFEVAIGGPPA